MINFTIDTSGLKELQLALLNKAKEIERDLDTLVRASGEVALAEAKKLTPVDQGILRGSNNLEKVDIMQYKISNNMPYAPYVEFGTGAKVDVPEEFTDFAEQFKGKKSGTYADGLKSIEDWLKRKGGDPEDAKWVFYLILKNGINAQPFLYPAYKKARKVLIKDVTDYVNNFGKDE